MDPIHELLRLSHTLGSAQHGLAMLGEGNASVRLDETRFRVKASGSCLGTLKEDETVECASRPLLALFERDDFTDAEIAAALLACRLDPQARKPSVEALFHAYLLSLPGIRFVGHAHPLAANAFLCSEASRLLAEDRIFPDEIVCCGDRSVLVPYVDPGLPLAIAIRGRVEAFRTDFGELPRVILLENHGVITLGPSVEAVEAAMLMCEKAARVRLGAATLGGVRALTPDHVRRISTRGDEHERRKALGLQIVSKSLGAPDGAERAVVFRLNHCQAAPCSRWWTHGSSRSEAELRGGGVEARGPDARSGGAISRLVR